VFVCQVACVDLLAPGVGEICGGSLREERFDVLQQLLANTAFADSLDWFVTYLLARVETTRCYGG